MPPIFDYQCTACGLIEERMVKEWDDVIFCNVCGHQPERLVSAGTFKFAGRVVQGGGPDRFTADMLGVPLKELPDGLKT